MDLFSTYYPTNERIVSGTVNIKQDDVVLLCDTSGGPVTINLLKIPSASQTYASQGNWSTQYKLYVVDISNNASTNNITIVAPTGFKINAQPQQVISTNGGSLVVRIVSNLDYIGLGALSIGTSIPYVISAKSLQTNGTTFISLSANHTVRLGQIQTVYTTKVETGIMSGSFSLATGIFTVPATGVYNLNAEIICQINANPNVVTDGLGAHWVTNATDVKHFTIAILKALDEQQQILVTANNKAITQDTSDIIISASAMNIPLTKNDQLYIRVLNETNHDVVGVNQSDNRVIFSAHKIA